MVATVVAIDLGASSGRVLRGVFQDGTLTVEECSRFPNGPVHVPAAGADELQWDVLFLWQGIRNGLTEAARRGPVDAIAIDSWAVDYGLVDTDGRLLGNPFCYRSTRTASAVESFHSTVSPVVLHEHNGLQFQPFNTLFQILADTSAVQFTLADTLLLVPDLLGYWLTGRRICEVTNASTTGLVDPATRAWDPWLLERLDGVSGVEASRVLAPLVEPGALVGPVSFSEVDLHTHTGEPTPLVAVGSHDTASAVAGVPAPGAVACRKERRGAPSFGFVSSGTWSLVGVELDAPVRTEASRAANFTNELGVDGTVRYLKNIMGMWIQQECLRQWRDSDMRHMSWAQLDADTEAAPPLRTLLDVNDPVFVAPGDMTTRIDTWATQHGEPVPRDRGEYLRALTESLVVAYRRALRQATELSGTPLETVHIVGGGSRNALLCQLTADATGLPVVAGPVEGTAMGNMVVQLRAVGALQGGLDELRQVVADSVETTRYEPTPGARQLWDAAEERLFGTSPGAAPPPPTPRSSDEGGPALVDPEPSTN